ncbi:RNA 2',3'-cyclic phosphodiesterase [Fibrobacterota bacterium]
MKRLFVGLGIPSPVMAALRSMCYGVSGARWEDENRMHLSLRFIGEVDGMAFREILEQLSHIVHPSFEIKIKGVGFFPPRGMPRVLWAGIERNDQLLALQHKIENTLVRKTGLKPERRNYFPHVTLARLKRVLEKDVARFVMDHSLLQMPPFTAGEFHLFSSILSAKGSKYFKESTYELIKKPDAGL